MDGWMNGKENGRGWIMNNSCKTPPQNKTQTNNCTHLPEPCPPPLALAWVGYIRSPAVVTGIPVGLRALDQEKKETRREDEKSREKRREERG
jgi:hypothetical protein